MKKICSITTIAKSMENFMYPEALALKQAGWDSVVISNFEDYDRSLIPDGLRWMSVPMERTYNLRAAWKSISRLYRIFRREKFDVVQYGTTHACLFGSIAAFMARVPNRVFLQWGPTGYNDYTGARRLAMKSMEKLIGRLSTTIRTASRKNLAESVADGLYPAAKASVVGEGGTIGVDLSEYRTELKEDYRREIRAKYGIGEHDFVFGYVGRVAESKGIAELLRAFKGVHDRFACKLMLIGADELKAEIPLLDWARECPDVIFTGSVRHSDMARHFAAIDVLVHPTYREGFGMVLQEAMAIEVPIITTDIPGPSEVIEDGVSGLLVKVKDAGALREAMERLISDPHLCRDMGRAGRSRVEKHFERLHRLRLLVEDKERIMNK